MPISPVADVTPLAGVKTSYSMAKATTPANTSSSSSSTSPTSASSTSSTTSTSSTSSTSSSASSTSSTQADSDRFLTLLVTQLKNQDPLNPLDNAQVTTQLAQISTVSGINKLNDTVAALSASFSANQYLQATGLVDHNVVVPGNGITLAAGHGSYGVALASAADSMTVTIKDAAGNVVRTIDLGAQASGYLKFDWDGKNAAGKVQADGKYTFEVSATAKGKPVSADALSIGKVTGVSRTDSGAILTLAGLGTVALSDVLQIN